MSSIKVTTNITDELKQSYLAYAMTTILHRALPDVRDGLKPVHRRILYAMYKMEKNNSTYKKSARVVGDVIGKYHPHGDSAVYEAIVHMVQTFYLHYPLIQGQGNFGSIDGDPAAAMRYTEVRLTKYAKNMLEDIECNTVNFLPNYDNSCTYPETLPAKIPNLLLNGTTGIAVGLSTNIPPHNFSEIVKAVILLLDDVSTSIEKLLDVLHGPDLPTGGIIQKTQNLVNAYKYGKGIIKVQAKIEKEINEKKRNIIIKEIPYQVNKTCLIEQIVSLVKQKKINGISGIKDETDKQGIFVVINVKKQYDVDVLLHNLLKKTQLEISYGINCVAIVQNRPKLLNLKEILLCFIEYRVEVITRKFLFKLDNALEQINLLVGLLLTLSNIEHIIETVKKSTTKINVKEKLLAEMFQPSQKIIELLQNKDIEMHFLKNKMQKSEKYKLNEKQVNAILELKLYNLTNLEYEKLIEQIIEKTELINTYEAILNNKNNILKIIKNDLIELNKEHIVSRKTKIVSTILEKTKKDFVEKKNIIVVLTQDGYLKVKNVENYNTQKRGGKGKLLITKKNNELINTIISTTTHSTLLVFTTKGKAYSIECLDLLLNKQHDHINTLLTLDANEKITAIINHGDILDKEILLITETGLIKKINTNDITKRKKINLIVINFKHNDKLISASVLPNEATYILIVSSCGKIIKFNSNEIKTTGRTSCGVRGMRLKNNAKVVALLPVKDNTKIFLATKQGYGKKADTTAYRTSKRGGIGVIGVRLQNKDDCVVGAFVIENTSQQCNVLLLSKLGTIIKTPIKTIPELSRNTKGVKLINLREGDYVLNVDFSRLEHTS